MTEEVVLLLGSSLLSGLIGVVVSACFFARLERRKLKVDTARRLLGSRFNIEGTEFQQAMNEVLVVFSDEKRVTKAMDEFWNAVEKERGPDRGEKTNAGLLKVLKAVCSSVGLHPKNLSDAEYDATRTPAPARRHSAVRLLPRRLRYEHRKVGRTHEEPTDGLMPDNKALGVCMSCCACGGNPKILQFLLRENGNETCNS